MFFFPLQSWQIFLVFILGIFLITLLFKILLLPIISLGVQSKEMIERIKILNKEYIEIYILIRVLG